MAENAFETIPGRSGQETVNSRLLFLCDHASNRLPAGGLGLDPALLATHIAYDIGAASLTRALAKAYGAPALLGGWSRLLIDLNRGADDPTLVMKLSDGSIIPGNVSGDGNADAAEVARRIAAYHAPYHAAIDAELDRLGALPRARDSAHAGEMAVAGSRASESQRGRNMPAVISMHSFTPAWKGRPRPWQVGVLYDRDTRLSAPLMARLAEAGFTVGDNEPYTGALEGDTLYQHGTLRGLPHVLIEIRQDLIVGEAAAQEFASRLKPILDLAISDMHRQE